MPPILPCKPEQLIIQRPFLYVTVYVPSLHLVFFHRVSPVNGSVLKWTPYPERSLWSSCGISSQPGDNKFLNYLRLMWEERRWDKSNIEKLMGWEAEEAVSLLLSLRNFTPVQIKWALILNCKYQSIQLYIYILNIYSNKWGQSLCAPWGH